jgi:hypothetical protein
LLPSFLLPLFYTWEREGQGSIDSVHVTNPVLSSYRANTKKISPTKETYFSPDYLVTGG